MKKLGKGKTTKNMKKIIASIAAVGATVIALVGVIRYKNRKDAEDEFDDEVYFDDEDDCFDESDAEGTEDTEE